MRKFFIDNTADSTMHQPLTAIHEHGIARSFRKASIIEAAVL